MKFLSVAACQLKQWSLDFDGNRRRIIQSIQIAGEYGAQYRTGPDLEICGCDLGKYIFEEETHVLCWRSLRMILDTCRDTAMILDIGMPLQYSNDVYSSRFICRQGCILRIVPTYCIGSSPHKFTGNTPYLVPPRIQQLGFTTFYPMSIEPFILATPTLDGLLIATQSCSSDAELIQRYHTIDLLINTYCHTYEIDQHQNRVKQIHNALLVFPNLLYMIVGMNGSDSGKCLYTGSTSLFRHSHLANEVPLMTLSDCQILIEHIQTKKQTTYDIHIEPSQECLTPIVTYNHVTTWKNLYKNASPELSDAMSVWLWDYLVKSGFNGFFLPLSGGADSAAACASVAYMCRKVMGDSKLYPNVRIELAQVLQTNDVSLESSQCLVHRLLYTVYLATSNSSKATQDFASAVAKEAHARHFQFNMSNIIESFSQLLSGESSDCPKIHLDNSLDYQNLALQNIQARTRMVATYFLSGILPGAFSNGTQKFLVLGTGNNDECLTGYFAKYDSSSADLNPIGSLSKCDLRTFLIDSATALDMPTLRSIAKAPPTAELCPGIEHHKQTDEDDMQLTYQQISELSTLRTRCGPVDTCKHLFQQWNEPHEKILQHVMNFYSRHRRNRHKMHIMTPSLHLDPRDCNPHGYDDRPLLYPSKLDEYVDLLSLEMKAQNP